MVMDTDSQWTYDRMQLYKLWKTHPQWSQKRLAEKLGYSLRWVKKWLGRFRQTAIHKLDIFASRSRAPKNPASKITKLIRDMILQLRQSLPEKYGRVVGPNAIAFHLDDGGYFPNEDLPTSTATIWKVLKEASYIPEKLKTHQPLKRVDPMSEWEFDFGEAKIAKDAKFEIAPLIDCGTSILIDVPLQDKTYQADSTLEMLIEVFREHGFPLRLRFERDPRLIGSVGMDDFPSAFMRFAWCIGMEPIVCPPRRPDKKPYVERVIRTLKHECLYIKKPATQQKAQEQLKQYQAFYNYERAHQGLSCGNQPPMKAHPDLPALKRLPKRINPDAWLDVYHGEIFKRQITSNGVISIDNPYYSLGRQYALQVAVVHLDACERVFHITVASQRLKPIAIQGLHHRFMDFDDYAELMITEARAIARQQGAKK